MFKKVDTGGPASWNGWRMAEMQNPKDICLKVLDRRGRTCLEWRFKSIFAHKKVLASGSPVFKAQFYPERFGDNSYVMKLSCKEGGCDVLEIKDTSVEAVELMVDFLYGKEIKWAWECKSPESVYDVCLLASKYAVQKLTSIAVKQLIRKDAILASEFLDPEIISACAENMFSEVKSVKELQKLAGLFSLSNNPADWRAFCFFLPYFKLEFCSEMVDSKSDAGNDLPILPNSKKEIPPSPVITLADSPTSLDLLSSETPKSTVFPPTGNSFSFLTSVLGNENSDISATPQGFLFSPPTPVRDFLSIELSPNALFPKSFLFLKSSASNKSFKFSSPTDVFNPIPPLPVRVDKEASVMKNNPDDLLSSVAVPDIAISLKTFFAEELELEPGSPNLLDDHQLFSAECSPSRLPSTSEKAFSSIKSPRNVTNTKNLTADQRNQIIHECVEDQISPTDLAKKWQCAADTIRTWVRKSGKQLPKQYKKFTYPPDPQNSRLPSTSEKAFSSIKSPLTVTNCSSITPTDADIIIKTHVRVNKPDGDKDVKRGTIRCKPFELLRKEVSIVKEDDVQKIEILPKMKDIERQVEVVEIEDEDLPIRNQWIHRGATQSHKRCIQGLPVNVDPVYKYPCSERNCLNVKMSSLQNWRRHMTKVHNNPHADFSGTPVNVNKKTKFDVEIDPFDFDLDNPVEKYPSEIVFKCEMCDFTSARQICIKIHKESDHNWCSLCYSSFTSQEKLRIHIKYIHCDEMKP